MDHVQEERHFTMYKYAFIVDVTVFAPTQYVCQIIHSEILLSLQKKITHLATTVGIVDL